MRRGPVDPPAHCHFAVVDLETTGLKADDDHILQMAVVHQDVSGRRLGEWSTYVRPPHRWSASLGPREIHGITRRKVVFAPPLLDAMRTFVGLTRGCVIVAHNAAFDLGFLRAASKRTGVELEHSGSLCTLHLARLLGERGQSSNKLSALCDEFDVDPGRAHDALDDARSAGQVLVHLMNELGLQSIDDVSRHVRR